MATATERWSSLVDVCAALHKHPVSFQAKLKKLRMDGYLKNGVHFLKTGEHKTSKILWDLEELEKFFVAKQPKREG